MNELQGDNQQAFDLDIDWSLLEGNLQNHGFTPDPDFSWVHPSQLEVPPSVFASEKENLEHQNDMWDLSYWDNDDILPYPSLTTSNLPAPVEETSYSPHVVLPANEPGFLKPEDSSTERKQKCIVKQPKASKPRIRCEHPGCKSTFPRKYELQRHISGVHSLDVSLLCPIYGCKRASKPFPRADKFHEHVRTHKNPSQFICFMDQCHLSPLTKDELEVHLGTRHLSDHDCQEHLDDYMACLPFLGHKRFFFIPETPRNYGSSWVLFEVAELRAKGKDICPAHTRGCNFRLSIEEPYMEKHLQAHDLMYRVQWKGPLKRFLFDTSIKNGPASCPICGVETSSLLSPQFNCLTDHLVDVHTPFERSLQLKELSTLFSVFYSPGDRRVENDSKATWLKVHASFRILVTEFQAASLVSDPLRFRFSTTETVLTNGQVVTRQWQ